MKEEKKMKINKVELIPVTVPLEQPIRHAFYARTEGKHIIVKIYSRRLYGNWLRQCAYTELLYGQSGIRHVQIKRSGKRRTDWRKSSQYGNDPCPM
jgi:hypothetical protein